MSEELLQAVRARLRGHEIKLWLPPYCVDGSPQLEAVVALLPTVFAQRHDNPALRAASDAALVQSLTHLMAHSLRKLQSRGRGAGEASGAQRTSCNLRSSVAGAAAADAVLTVRCKVVGAPVPGEQAREGPKNTLVLSAVPLATRGSELGRMVLAALFGGDGERDLASLRLIAGGRQLGESDPIVRHGVRDGVLSMLAIVSEKHRDAGSDGAATRAEDPILLKARKIHDAAALLATRDFHRDFELTDQHGRAVPLPPQERAHLCAALALHTLGKKVLRGKLGGRIKEPPEAPAQPILQCMERLPGAGGSAANSPAGGGTQASDGTHASHDDAGEQDTLSQKVVADALGVLLESDAAWARVSETWKQQVDNFGLLQLEIIWCHLNLEQLSALPDAAARIKLAETVLLKQVNPNFLKLAVMNAEEGRPVPPLAAPFVRLLLLQGVIQMMHERNVPKAIGTLKEAQVLCEALVVDGKDLVELLRLGASQDDAVVALRKSAGDVQRAAGEILDQIDTKRRAAQDRAKQRRLGLTANREGYVDLSRIESVKDFLAVSNDVAVALLRLANNNIDEAANVWHEANRQDHFVLARARAISQRQNTNTRSAVPTALGAAAGNAELALEATVDELVLVQLISTGVDKELAEIALRSTAGKGQDPLEAALNWLASDDAFAAEARTEGSMLGGGANAVTMDFSQGKIDSSSGGDGMSEHESGGDMESAMEEARHEEAYELFQRELGDSLQRSEMAEEHLGMPLHDERALISQYLARALSLTCDSSK